jgi:hypothetical protein
MSGHIRFSGFNAVSAQPKYVTILPPRVLKRVGSSFLASMKALIA